MGYILSYLLRVIGLERIAETCNLLRIVTTLTESERFNLQTENNIKLHLMV